MEKYMIAIPCLDTVPVPFAASLSGLRYVGESRASFHANSIVYDARDMLAAEAIDTGATRILFIDSDMQFAPDMMERMAADMDEHNLDYVCGIYFKRRLPTTPCIYKKVELKDDGTASVESYTNYPRDELFPIAGSGFGAVMLTTKMLKDVYDTFGRPFLPFPGVLGEDLSFCWRAKQIGYEMYCDSRIKVGHVGLFNYSEPYYQAQPK